jgi:hypothetical protein
VAKNIKLAISNALSVKMTAGGQPLPPSVHGAAECHGESVHGAAASDILSVHGAALADPMLMMTQPPVAGDESQVVSVHGAFSVHLPEALNVSRVEIQRDENGDLIVILHE